MRVPIGSAARGLGSEFLCLCFSSPLHELPRDQVLQSWSLFWGHMGESCACASGLLWPPVTNGVVVVRHWSCHPVTAPRT